MDANDIGRLTYLILLGTAVVGSFFLMNKAPVARSLQQFAIWALIFIGAIGAYGVWTDMRYDLLPRQSVLENGSIEVPRKADGHFYLTLEVNGEPVDFVVDTGASDVVLSAEDARRVGLDPATLDYVGTARTANGRVRTAPARVETAELGGYIVRNMKVYVNEGEMDMSLLGMAYLRRFERIEIADDTLILTE